MMYKARRLDAVRQAYTGVKPTTPSTQAVLSLLDQLVASDYALGLYGYSSHSTIGLLQTPEHDASQERLLIHPLDDTLAFAYTDCLSWPIGIHKLTLCGKPAWTATYSYEQSFAALERFFRRAGWFPHAHHSP